jgi:hypothetical protein
LFISLDKQPGAVAEWVRNTLTSVRSPNNHGLRPDVNQFPAIIRDSNDH